MGPLFGILMLLVPAVQATSFFERPFPDTVKSAPVILRGRIGTTYTDWGRGDEGNKRIYTFWEVQVAEVFKGDAPTGTILMRELGGEKDGVGMQVSGASQFRPGEDVVVFLSERNAEASYDVYGMMMGKFEIEKDAQGREYLLGPAINDLTAPRIGDGHEGHDGPSGAKKWTLEQLRKLVISQGDAPAAPARPAQSREISKRPVSSPPASPSSPVVADPAAPRLQNSPPEDSTAPAGSLPGWKWAVGTAVLGLLMVLIARRRS